MGTELLTMQELAARLKVKRSTVASWLKAGRVPAIRVNAKVVRFDYESVVAELREGVRHD